MKDAVQVNKYKVKRDNTKEFKNRCPSPYDLNCIKIRHT